MALDALVGDEPVEQRADRVELGRRRGAVEPPPLGEVPRAEPGPGRAVVRAGRAAAIGPPGGGRTRAASSARARARGPAAPPARGARREQARRRRPRRATTEPKRIGRIASTAAAMRRTAASWPPERPPRPPPGAASIRPTTTWNPRPGEHLQRSRRSPRPGVAAGRLSDQSVEIEDAHARRFRGASRSAAHRSADRRR